MAKRACDCHPDREYCGRGGLCIECYLLKHPKSGAATCHPGRIKKSGLMCEPCWKASRSALDAPRRSARTHGITDSEYGELVTRSGGRCEICGSDPSPRMLHLDHCHTTGVIRGLLCGRCNMGLGLLGDSSESVGLALGYLTAPPADVALKGEGR